MYHVSAQGVDERTINVQYYYYHHHYWSLSYSAYVLCSRADSITSLMSQVIQTSSSFFFKCCLTSTERVMDGETMASTSTFTQLLSSTIQNEWLYLFFFSFFMSTEVVYWQRYNLVVTWLVPRKTVALLWRICSWLTFKGKQLERNNAACRWSGQRWKP